VSKITKSFVSLIVFAAIAVGIWIPLSQKAPHEPLDSFEAFDMVRIGHVPKGKELEFVRDAFGESNIRSSLNGGMMHYTIAVPRVDFERATELLVADSKARGYEFIVDPDLGPAPAVSNGVDFAFAGFVSEMDERVTDRVLGILRANFGRDFDYRCSVVCGVWVLPEAKDRAAALLLADSKQGDYRFTEDWRDDEEPR
jgi:hypothetical protein